MFSISTKGIYGLSALVDLSESFLSGSRQIKDIAQRQNIPQHYLEQILVNLKKAGFVVSQRGSLGGYMLARHPSQISVEDCLNSLEGKLEVLPADKVDNKLAFFWNEIELTLKKMLKKNLEELLIEFQSHQNQLYFEI